MTVPALPAGIAANDLARHARGYWVAARFIRCGDLPGDVVDALVASGDASARHARECAKSALLVIDTVSPRLRKRVRAEWGALSRRIDEADRSGQ